MLNKIYDCIIIGGGPSGLSAASVLSKAKINFLLLEKGTSWHSRNKSKLSDISSGIGGAGLFSDGKFSFYPSAIKLWEKLECNKLKGAYLELQNILKEINYSVNEFNNEWCGNKKFRLESIEKKYYSIKTSETDRNLLIQYLLSKIEKNSLKTNTEVIEISYSNNKFILKTKKDYFYSKTIIFAGGKSSKNQIFKSFPKVKKEFIRYEIGFRLETLSRNFDYYYDKQIDKKIIISDKKYSSEIRTFCCCRDGKIIKSFPNGYLSINGYTDENKTEFSNIGINLRITSLESNIELVKEIEKLYKQKKSINFTIKLIDFINNPDILEIGKNIKDKLIPFIKNYFPNSINEYSTISGISLEGFGFYPKLNSSLKVLNLPIWIPGDSNGLFRGLTPAFISGFYVGNEIKILNQKLNLNTKNKISLKQSPTTELPIVFTAMSKTHFYCRDAVCEYVFNKKMLPINPFRVFDYFLSERVERDLIRQGNNKLVKISDELWVFGHISDGVLFEIHLAHKYNKPIKFFNIDSIASNIHPINASTIRFEPEVHAKQITRKNLLDFIKNNIINITTDQLELDFGDNDEF